MLFRSCGFASVAGAVAAGAAAGACSAGGTARVKRASGPAAVVEAAESTEAVVSDDMIGSTNESSKTAGNAVERIASSELE